MRIIVEGWRFIPRSHSILSQFQMLEMLKRGDLTVFHKDLPYLLPSWQPVTGLFNPEQERILKQIPQPDFNCFADATWRISYPFNLTASPHSQRTCIFATTEWGIVHNTAFLGGISMQEASRKNPDTIIVTTSRWSRDGFLRSGAEADRVCIVPLGYEPNIYKPISYQNRIELRKKLGWDRYFVFLNVGVMLNNKGVPALLQAFAAIVDRYPDARLVLKGTDSLFTSQNALNKMLQSLTDKQREKIIPKLIYIGKDLSFAEMASLYQAADVYVSPYLAEGFNMPVLEAIACGLPVICTKGGSTDDFTHPDFALAIDSQILTVTMNKENRFYLHPNLEHLITLMINTIEQPSFIDRARQAGPIFAANGFTWQHITNKLLKVLVPSHNIRENKRSAITESGLDTRPIFEPIIF